MSISSFTDVSSAFSSGSLIPPLPFPLAGNPALSAAASIAAKTTSSSAGSSALTERLFVARPRSTSNDNTNRGPHGYLRLLGASGQNRAPSGYSRSESSSYADSLRLLTSGTGGSGYDKFLITGVSTTMDEKVQITEVFGDVHVAYYFGHAPQMFTITGTLIDSPDNSWFTDWIYLYADLASGSKLAQNREQISLVLPNMTINGAMTNFSYEQGSGNDVAINFRFTVLASSLLPTPFLATNVAITNSASMIDFSSVANFSSQTQNNKIKQALQVIQNPISSLAGTTAAMGSFVGPLPRPGSPTLDSGIASAGGLMGSLASTIDGWTKSTTSGLTSILGKDNTLGGLSTSISTIRANLFLPVYGVMNSLSKLVGAVFGVNGLNSLLTGLTAPIRNILGDITRFAQQATAIANMVSSGVNVLGRNIKSNFGITQAYQQAIQAVSQASGTIASLPGSIGEDIQAIFSSGVLPPSSAFLKMNTKATLSLTPPSLHLSTAYLPGYSPQLAILSKGPSKSSGAYL